MAEQNPLEPLKIRGLGQDGQALAEYALILIFIALAAIASLVLLGSSIQGFFTSFSGSF
ncbi:MAG: Flp family type IVb pilin [Deltaproteobacteria bacterium]